MKQIYLPLALSYIAHWVREEGIRELVANARDTVGADSDKIIFAHEEQENGLFRLSIGNKTDGAKLETRHLVMGVSEHRNSTESIGQFGEGLKLAIVTLLREAPDQRLVITNHDEIWTIEAVENPDMGDVEMPRITIQDCEPQGHVLFHIEDLSKRELASVLNMVWEFVPKDGVVLKNDEVELAQLDSSSVGASMLYVGGIAMGEYKTGYAVNTIPFGIAVNRDRKMPNSLEEVQDRLRTLITEQFESNPYGPATLKNPEHYDFILDVCRDFELFENVATLGALILRQKDADTYGVAGPTKTDYLQAEILYWIDREELDRDFKQRWGYGIDGAFSNGRHIHNNWWKAASLKKLNSAVDVVGDDVLRRAHRLADSTKADAQAFQSLLDMPVSVQSAQEVYNDLHQRLYDTLSDLMEAGDAAAKTNELLDNFKIHLV